MPLDNLTAVLYGCEDLRLEQRPIPEISDHEVLVEMDCVGMTYSDLQMFLEGRLYSAVVRKPLVLGIEGSGIVVRIGKSVQGFNLGDRIGLEPGYGCRNCEWCKVGRYNLCPDLFKMGHPPNDGLLTKFHRHPADSCYKLAPELSMEEGTLLEPISLAIHACRRAQIGPGSNLLVIGAGRVGLCMLLVAEAMGAENVLVTDLNRFRLEIAASMGANYTLQVDLEIDEKEVVKQIHATMNSTPNRTIICCSCAKAVTLAIHASQPGGIITLLGLSFEAKIPLDIVCSKELKIRGSFLNCNDYTAAMGMIANGKINVKPLITHRFDLKDINKAINMFRYRQNNCISVIMHCRPEDE